VENFPISGQRFPREFLYAMGLIKWAMAKANGELGFLDVLVSEAIAAAASEVADGHWDDQFPVDIYQTGSGTSTNMNANEVIAARAAEILYGERSGPRRIHPNDHVNRGQSSNDVIPTAIHIAAVKAVVEDLVPALDQLCSALERKALEFERVVKIGRTHLQDAVPMTLGQAFSGYATQVERGRARVRSALRDLFELPLGGTAVGTGLNASRRATERAIDLLGVKTGIPYGEAANHFEAQAARDAAVQLSGCLKTLAVSLMKVANDIRWLGSGPRCGIGEILLPATQPGSSIMPGKVNPVQAEALTMVCARVMGNDATVTLAGQSGVFELNVMMPVLACALLESIRLLAGGVRTLTERCVVGIRADEERAAEFVERSLALVTVLAPVLGYDRAAALAKQAYSEGRTIREILQEQAEIPDERLAELLDPWQMMEPAD
jgi:fumarate hydratase class II